MPTSSFPPSLIADPIASARELQTAPRFHRGFQLLEGHGVITRAVLRATALGVYEVTMNDSPVSEDVLSPGWSSYEWRLRYQTYEVTDLLDAASTEQTIAVTVGNGWYRGRLGWEGMRNVYGDRRGLLLQLDMQYQDGHVETISSDEKWTVDESEVVADDLYDGQTIDARRRISRPVGESETTDQPARSGTKVERITYPGELVAQTSPPVRRHESLLPEAIWTSPGGKTLVDFGQNLVGWVQLKVQGPEGTVITLRHAEVLENEELGTRPLRSAKATDKFILSGEADIFEPSFTFHGFRYVEVDGFPGELETHNLSAVVVHSQMERTGTFTTSNELLNQFHANVVWGLRGNFLDVPTDCPQRDERLGWTGDIAVFAPTATYLYDVGDFLKDWLQDLAAEQFAADGLVPYVVPDLLKYQGMPKEFGDADSTAIWSDAAVWVPWALWEAYGDQNVLADQYPSMVAHLRRVLGLLDDRGLWTGGFQFGDWLDPDASPHRPAEAKADPGVVATACLVRTARMVSASAEILGEQADAAEFRQAAERSAAAFAEHYVDNTGRIYSDCTTVYTLAIVFDVLPESLLTAAGDRLAELVQASGHTVSTGFAGTPYVTDALTRTGHLQDAYRLILQESNPSWLYPVTKGATTVWERWDSILPDGSINPGEMTSFNHYALGSVADWLHRVVGGISPAAPGYSRVRIAPRPPTGDLAQELTWADSSLKTPHGVVRCRWELIGSTVKLSVTIPDGVRGEIDIPGSPMKMLDAGEHQVSLPR